MAVHMTNFSRMNLLSLPLVVISLLVAISKMKQYKPELFCLVVAVFQNKVCFASGSFCSLPCMDGTDGTDGTE